MNRTTSGIVLSEFVLSGDPLYYTYIGHGTITFGDFGPAPKEVVIASGGLDI